MVTAPHKPIHLTYMGWCESHIKLAYKVTSKEHIKERRYY
jgi:hypothetical protein